MVIRWYYFPLALRKVCCNVDDNPFKSCTDVILAHQAGCWLHLSMLLMCSQQQCCSTSLRLLLTTRYCPENLAWSSPITFYSLSSAAGLSGLRVVIKNTLSDDKRAFLSSVTLADVITVSSILPPGILYSIHFSQNQSNVTIQLLLPQGGPVPVIRGSSSDNLCWQCEHASGERIQESTSTLMCFQPSLCLEAKLYS